MKNEIEVPALQVPPYGIMDNEYLKNLGSENLPASPAEPIVPPDFHAPASCGKQPREHCWKELRDKLIDEMADALWPVWDPQSRSWDGRSAKKMLELTRADMDILFRLRVGQGSLPIDALPDSKVRSLNCPAHSAFFLEEDQGKIFASYPHYDRSLDPKIGSTFGGAFFAGLAAKCSSTSLQFKRRFQRPRAYQMAFLMGKTEFNLEEGVSSMTPSMVSGHCLQGLIGVGAVMERVIQSGISLDEDKGKAMDSWQALSQYAVDIGDRRVMAGIHYPSDNLGSWIVLIGLANHIYRSREIKEKLWKAITTQSLIYRFIRESEAEVYSPALDLLDRMKKS